ncbi:hypothetical protein [Telluria beijingensis]|uniref:hypothetical protein n=1 Tax=Telluria beijingensis TaxID=3068633 RepID=UPI0027961995|nr:hypothetical protein [Massilia sp. REN29]
MKITTTTVVLQPGMYVLRHPKGGLPALTVTRAPGTAAHNGGLETLSTPNTHGSILRDGADCIVMHVTRGPVELAVSAYLPDATVAVPSLRIDQIALDPVTPAPAQTPAPARAPAPATVASIPAPAVPAPAAAPALPAATAAAKAAPRRIEIGGKGISVIAHIERTGDVVAGEGNAVGDPKQSLRVEGFQVMWPDRPAGVDLAYRISVEGAGQMPAVTTGKFCGTRGQARRITELSFTLVGPDAANYALEGQAWFSGGFQLPVSSGATLGGPSGLEHLTALSLKAVPANAKTGPTGNPWVDSAATKVFRATTASPAKPAGKKFAATNASKGRKA